ncbi:MAG: DUF87 domain-containing protein [Eubacteriales bacterium]|nr:DUF87 domain-containing protein [Eubacteriales bacterium]
MEDKKPKLELLERERITIASSILVEKIYDSEILSYGSRYVKVFKISDINYNLSDDKSVIEEAYKNVLNSTDKNVEISLIIDSKKLAYRFIEEKVLLKHKADNLNHIRDGINENIKKNSSTETLVKDKYLVIAFTEDKVKKKYKENAMNRMQLLSDVVVRNFESIANARLIPLNADDMLKFLYYFYNRDRIEDKVKDDDFDMISKKTIEDLGISARELIAPHDMVFKNDFIKMNSKYIIALHMVDINKRITTEVLEKLTNNNFPIVIALKERPIDALTTNKLIGRELSNIEGEIYDIQGNLSKSNVSIDLIPQNLKIRREEAININESIRTKNDGLFDMGLYALIYGDSYEECKDNVYACINNATLVGIYFEESIGMQEEVFNTIMPYGINQTLYTRCINSEGLSGFIPFNAMDLIDEKGDYYGRNLITNNPIVYDVMNGDNYSMLLFGMTGKGKSMISKQTLYSRVLRDDNRSAIIIDASGEYVPIVKEIKGQVINIEAGGVNHINLFDIDDSYGENPLADKEDMILSVCGLMQKKTLSAGQRTTVSIAVAQIYKDWITDKSKIPTIEDFEKELERVISYDSSEDDKELLKAIKYYSKTSHCTLFRGKSNIDLKNRVINYNISNLGKELRPMAMEVLLDNIWLTISKNRAKGIDTDIIIDEFHLMFLNDDTASFMSKLWKMLRKSHGCPMGITQNPEDVMNSFFGRDIIANTGFLVSLSLQESDIRLLKEILLLTEKEVNYIRNKDSGTGLIYVYSSRGKGTRVVVPFENHYDKNNLFYKLANTSDKLNTSIK